MVHSNTQDKKTRKYVRNTRKVDELIRSEYLYDRAHFWDQINLPPPDECQTYLASLTGGRWPRIRGYTR